MILYLGAGLVIIWLIACVALIVFARTLIYPFRPGISAFATVGIPRATVVTFAAEDSTELTAWVVPPNEGHPVIPTPADADSMKGFP